MEQFWEFKCAKLMVFNILVGMVFIAGIAMKVRTSEVAEAEATKDEGFCEEDT